MKSSFKAIFSMIFCICLLSCEKETDLLSKRDFETSNEETNYKIDIDLSALSVTMAYAEAYRIMSSPDNYIGKTIKVNGTYATNFYEPTDKYYSFVLITDSTSCCTLSFEFEWPDKSYPEDYPQEGDTIEIVGLFGCYDELGITYYSLNINYLKI